MVDILQTTPDMAKTETAKKDFTDSMLGMMGCFAVAWGLLGLASFTLGITADVDTLSRGYNPEQVAYMLETPAYVRFGHAMAAVCMLTGAVYLLLRKSSAYLWFMGALFGTLIVMLDSALRGGFYILGGMETGVNLGVTLVGIFLFWASYSALREGQLTRD